jgi:hypothetical protein
MHTTSNDTTNNDITNNDATNNGASKVCSRAAHKGPYNKLHQEEHHQSCSNDARGI